MSETLNVAVLMGGRSSEAAVSRCSAREVAVALEAGGHSTRLLELDRDLAAKLIEAPPDVVFPALHGPPGEDGTVQGLLEMLELPYVGSGVRGSAVAMDKSLAKAIFRRARLPLADDVELTRDCNAATAKQRILDELGARVVIKPLNQGSAVGVMRIGANDDKSDDKKDELDAALAIALNWDAGALVEAFIVGSEITVGVLDLHGDSAIAFPVIEIRTAAGQWYDFGNRYQPGASEHLIPAPLPAAVNAQLQAIALDAHRALGLRDLSRADFIVTSDRQITLLEVNSLPGMTPTSLYPDGARAAGWSFAKLVDALCFSALRRARAHHAI